MPQKPVLIGFAVALWVLTATAAFFFGLERGRTEPIPTHAPLARSTDGPSPLTRRAEPGTAPDWSAGFARERSPAFSAAVSVGAQPSAPAGSRTGSPVDALMAAAGLTDLRAREAALAQAAARLPAEAIPRALESLMGQPPGPERTRALAAVVRQWGKTEPLGALAYATDEPAPALREMLQRQAIHGWAAANPTEALAYVRENPDGIVPRGSIQSVFGGVAELPTAQALAFLTEVDMRPNARYIDDVVRSLYERSPAELVAWAQELPPGDLRNLAISETVDEWSRYDPESALAWMDEHAPEDLLPRVRGDLAENWARLDPEAAVAWFGGLPESDQSAQIMEGIFESWLRYEPETAAAWLGVQNPSPALDEAVREYIDYIDRVDPATAMEWAATLTEPRMQARETMRVSQTWVRADPAAALQYLESSSVQFRGREQLMAEARRRMERSQ
jgi:hypothetical protein